MAELAGSRFSFLILEAEVHLGEEDREVLLGEAEGVDIEAVQVPQGESEGDTAETVQVPIGETEGEVPLGEEFAKEIEPIPAHTDNGLSFVFGWKGSGDHYRSNYRIS